jgi:hypothetical protein
MTMPNRNAADEREKYDHSGHSTQHQQRGDLKPPGSGAAREKQSGNADSPPSEPKDPRQ